MTDGRRHFFSGVSPLRPLCASDGAMEIVKALLSRGADPSGGLQGALEFYYGDIVKLLIAKGADVNEVSVAFCHLFFSKTELY